jgi:hypothetical protein
MFGAVFRCPVALFVQYCVETDYGFIKEKTQSQDQQTQTAQEAARASPQEAHLAEVSFQRRRFGFWIASAVHGGSYMLPWRHGRSSLIQSR